MDQTSRTRDRGVVLDEAFATLQTWAIRLVAVAAAVYVLGWVIGHLWSILFPVALAIIVSTVLAPPVSWLRRHKVPSSLAALLTMVLFVGAIAVIIAILAPQVAGQVPDIASSASKGLTEVRNWLVDGPLGLTEDQVTNAIGAVQDRIADSADAITTGALSTVNAATSAVITFVLVLMLTFFFTKDGHKFVPWAQTIGGRRAGRHISEVLNRMWATVGGFIRTQTLVSFIDAVIIGLGLVILGVPLAIPLAVITFFGGYIPIIGAFVSGGLAVLVTLVSNDPTDAIWVLVIVIAVQQLEGNVLSPWLQGKSMNLHAAVVLLSVALGSTLFGITGAFLAVPVVAAAAEFFRYLNEQIDDEVDDDAPVEDSHAASLLEGRVTRDELSDEPVGER